MDSGKPTGQGSSLDSLRTVEFRQTLRGYHIDDVDEYLERVAVDAEALQEQVRQAGERLKQAAERIAQLEGMLQEAQLQPQSSGPQVSDDTLQRTLLLAQKFVDETKADAEAEAARIVADAEAKVRKVEADSEQRLREEIARLESNRSHLSHEVETLARQLETERERLRTALAEMLVLVDGNLPASNGGESRPSGDTPPLPNISDSPRGSAVAGEVTQLRPSGASRPATSASTS